MKFSWFIGRRLSLSSGNHKSSPAIKVSITAVALSVAVMIASLAVVIGFKREIREKVIGFNTHISLYNMGQEGEETDNLVTLTPTLAGILRDEPYITDFSLELSIPAILKTQSDFKGIYLRSLNGAPIRKFIASGLEEGNVPDHDKPENRNKIVISRTAARQLDLKTGDKIDTYFISDDLKARRLEVAGIYNSHFDQYDDVMAYGALPLLQGIANLTPSQGTSIQVETDDFDRVGEYTQRLNARLITATAEGSLYRYYHISNALAQGEGFFNWLALLDTNVIVVLTLMTIVAIATLISGMLILILDKKRFIGIIRALGAPLGEVRKVFIYLAMKVAVTGMLIGNAGMILFLYLQDRYHFLPLDADSYYIDFVPVELNWPSLIALNAACLLIIWLSLILPSGFVSRISPTEAMRDND